MVGTFVVNDTCADILELIVTFNRESSTVGAVEGFIDHGLMLPPPQELRIILPRTVPVKPAPQ